MRKRKMKNKVTKKTESEIIKKMLKVRREVWFTQWLVMCYDYSVLMNETGELYAEAFDYFEKEVVPFWQEKFDKEFGIKKTKDKNFIL
jgi:hypothetical protein